MNTQELAQRRLAFAEEILTTLYGKDYEQHRDMMCDVILIAKDLIR